MFTEFNKFLEERCHTIDSDCHYFISNQKCTKPQACNDGDENTCTSIIPTNYNVKKCHMDGGSCTETDKLCSYYDETWGDTCSDLKVETGKGDRCDFSYSKKCTPHFNACAGTPQDQCNNNIPLVKTIKCVWKSNSCQNDNRLCDDTYYGIQPEDCRLLKASDNAKKCFYLDKKCSEYYQNCEDYKGNNKTICENIKPINTAQNGFDLTKNCTFDSKATGDKCQTKDIMCTDYILEDEKNYEICYSLKVTDSSKKQCIYDFEAKSCKEEYKTCSIYNEISGVKKKEICQNITLTDISKKCVFENDICKEDDKKCSDYQSYQPETFCTGIPLTSKPTKICKYAGSKCVEDYKDCDAYVGDDKETCESIIGKDYKCILEKDFDCIKKTLTCSEAKNSVQCQSAVAVDSGKRCLFYNGICFEEYKSCNNYLGYFKKECENIILLNGNKCIFQSPQCLEYPKVCSEGLPGECSLITKVSDPERKICTYDSSSGSCFENYKYCNDYKENDATTCTKIKPYYSDGSGIDPRYKCVYNEKIGCERKLLGCSEAKNEVLCNAISAVLKTNSKKYCAFIDGVCSEQYQTCGDYKNDVQKEICQAIIPEDYKTKHCIYTESGDTKKCVEEANKCESFLVSDYEYYCISLNPFCSYSNGVCSNEKKSCDQLVFTSASDDNKAYCDSFKFEDTTKVCSLSSDKLKCEVIDTSASQTENKESSGSGDNSGSGSGTSTQTNQNTNSKANSSSDLLKLKRILLSFILFNLFI